MKRIVGRVALAVLLLVLIGVPVAAKSLGPGDHRAVQSADATPSGSTTVAPAKSVPHKRRTVVPTGTPPRPNSARSATYRTPYVYDDGVEVQVTHVKRTTLGKGMTAAHVKQGHAVQVLTVRITNLSTRAVHVAVASTRMTYGPQGKEASPVHGRSITSLLGAVPVGRSRSGEYAFAVPKKYLDSALLSFTFDAVHPAASFYGSLDYSPDDGNVFNDPTGTKDEQYAIIHHIEKSIDATKKGATITIAHYAFDVPGAADALLAAHRRGVNVKMIVDQHEGYVSHETRQLISALGHDRHRSSFLIRCKASCMSSHTSAMHVKFYLFTDVGGSHQVSMISSSNLTETNSVKSWNDLQTVVGNAKIYDSLLKYFNDMAPDKDRYHYYRTTASGPYKLYFFPQASRKNRPVVLLDVLDNVKCTGVAPGYGIGGHTVIRVGMYSWTSPRMDIATKLWNLHNKGCDVEIIYNSGRTSPAVTATLIRKSPKYGQMKIFDVWRDKNRNDSAELYMHEKEILIDGVWFDRPATKVVYAGSQNYVSNATTDNNEMIFRNINDATYDAYFKNWNSIRAHGNLSRTVPVIHLKVDPTEDALQQ